MPEEYVKPFSEHTEELVQRIKVVLYTFIISLAVMMVLPGNTNFFRDPINFYEPFVSVFLRYLREQTLPPHVRLIGLELTAPIELYVLASLLFAVAITLPVFAYEVYRFVDPALRPEERREVYPFVFFVTILFLTGVVFGLKVLSPYFIIALLPFFTAVGAEPIISIMDFYSLLFTATLATGLIFTFPAFFVLLVKYGLVGTEIFRRNRRYLYLGLLILAMLISPGSSPQGNFLLFTPMVILFELGLLIARRYEKKGKVRRVRLPWEVPKCKFCGSVIPSGASFCPKCGRAQK